MQGVELLAYICMQKNLNYQEVVREYNIDNDIMRKSGFDWDKPFIDWRDVEPVYDWFKECLTQ